MAQPLSAQHAKNTLNTAPGEMELILFVLIFQGIGLNYFFNIPDLLTFENLV